MAAQREYACFVIVLGHELEHPLQACRWNGGVGIHEHVDMAPCETNAKIAGAGSAQALTIKTFHPVTARVELDYFSGPVTASIIHHQHLDPRAIEMQNLRLHSQKKRRAFQNRSERGANAMRLVARGHDDRDVFHTRRSKSHINFVSQSIYARKPYKQISGKNKKVNHGLAIAGRVSMVLSDLARGPLAPSERKREKPSREAFGMRGIPALWVRVIQRGGTRGNAAHSKRFARFGCSGKRGGRLVLLTRSAGDCQDGDDWEKNAGPRPRPQFIHQRSCPYGRSDTR